MSAEFDELGSKIHQLSSLEIERVHVGVEALAQAWVKVLLSIGEQELGATYATGSTNADEAIAPVDGVHQTSSYRRIGVLYEISACD